MPHMRRLDSVHSPLLLFCVSVYRLYHRVLAISYLLPRIKS